MMKRSPEFEVDAIVDQLTSNKHQMASRGRQPACAQMRQHCYHFIERRNHSWFTVWWDKGHIFKNYFLRLLRTALSAKLIWIQRNAYSLRLHYAGKETSRETILFSLKFVDRYFSWRVDSKSHDDPSIFI